MFLYMSYGSRCVIKGYPSTATNLQPWMHQGYSKDGDVSLVTVTSHCGASHRPDIKWVQTELLLKDYRTNLNYLAIKDFYTD